MKEEIKKGRGRPRKGEESPKAKTKTTKRKKENRGGKREGAGRKPVDNPRVEHVSITTTKDVVLRVQQLRELTKHDDMPFNRMFESWVADLAKEYGIE